MDLQQLSRESLWTILFVPAVILSIFLLALQKLWTPLFTTKSKGMGFGLPVCKRLIEAHRGKILVESSSGKGTNFIIDIPIEQDSKQNEDFVATLSKTEVDTKVLEG